jgi:PAS domain S-box-containing protein
MEEHFDHPKSVRNLQCCINDLVSVLALPASWGGGDPARIASTVAETLLGMLDLDLVYVRLNESSSSETIEIIRAARWRSPAPQLSVLQSKFGQRWRDQPRHWQAVSRAFLGEEEITILTLPLGLEGEIGVLVAGSQRAEFPEETEKLVLSVAANQALIGLQQARLLSEQRRMTAELDKRVAERTQQHAETNDELRRQIAKCELVEKRLRDETSELGRSEARSKAIVDSALDGLVAVDHEARITEFNPAAEQTFGYRRDEVIGKTLSEVLVPPSLREKHEQGFARYLATGEAHVLGRRLEMVALCADGSEIPVEMAITRIQLPGPPSFTAYIRDITTRKRAEKALQENERNLIQTINTIPTAAWSTLPDGYCDFLNQQWFDYTGMTADEARGWGWAAAIHPDDAAGLQEHWLERLATGTPVNVEARMRRFDGVYRWILFLANPLRDDSGRIVKWYGTNIDIEDRKHAEQVLRASETNLRQIIDSISGLVCTMSPAGVTELVNRPIMDYFGKTFEELQSWTVGDSDAVHPDDLPRVVSEFTHSITTGAPFDSEVRLRRADGVYRWFHNSGRPMQDTDGRITRWYFLITDIDDRKRAEEALKANERDLIRTINTIPTPAFSTLPDGYVDFLNQRWLDYAGMTAEQAQGWGWGAALHPDDFDQLVQYWQSCLDSGTEAEVEARYRRFDGVYRWCLVRANPLRDESGMVVKWYGISIDIEDRKRAEEKLRSKERDLIRIINTIPTTAWSTRPDGYCEFLSDRWLDYAGYTLEQALGWSWAAVIHPDDAAGLKEHWLGRLATGTPVYTEARMRRFDGVYRWFLFLAKPLRDESGQIVNWYGTNVDIEDRKQAEEALRASERNLNLIINTIPALAWSASTDGPAEYLNQHYLDYIGLTLEEAMGWGWAAAVHPGDQNRLTNVWQSMLASDEGGECEARLRRYDGEYRWFLFRTNPLRDETGKTIKWYGTNTDINDRKRAEEELRRSESFLVEGQRLSKTGSFFWRVATEEIVWSEQLYRIFELDPGSKMTLELIGSRIHPEDLHILNDMVERAQSGSDLEYKYRLLLPDNKVRYLHVLAHGTKNKDGEWECVGAVQDVTERRLSEEALTKARAELAHVARVTSLGALTASIAHEVNQPLSGIITNASTCLRMLSAGEPNLEGARETARRTIRDGNRASEVVTRLRALFKRKEVAAESIDLNDAAREVIAISLSELQSNRINVQHDFAENLPAVKGDRIQLQGVILNLLRNASDAMRNVDDRPRQLLIKTESDDGKGVQLTVRDTGIGFAPDASDRLFESFYTTKEDGMGIGLSVSRSIIEAHRGRLWASANDGPGASFAFSIPPDYSNEPN